MSEFERSIEKFRTTPTDNRPALISETDLIEQRSRTNRHLRTRELLLQHSKTADLIVM